MGVTLKGRKLNFFLLKGALCHIWLQLVHCFWEEMSKTKNAECLSEKNNEL